MPRTGRFDRHRFFCASPGSGAVFVPQQGKDGLKEETAEPGEVEKPASYTMA